MSTARSPTGSLPWPFDDNGSLIALTALAIDDGAIRRSMAIGRLNFSSTDDFGFSLALPGALNTNLSRVSPIFFRNVITDISHSSSREAIAARIASRSGTLTTFSKGIEAEAGCATHC